MMYLLVELPSIEEVEHLHEDESVEDEGVVSRVDQSGIVDLHIVVFSLDGEETTTPNSAPHNSVQPLVSWIAGENS